jgi:hypothetical protein
VRKERHAQSPEVAARLEGGHAPRRLSASPGRPQEEKEGDHAAGSLQLAPGLIQEE